MLGGDFLKIILLGAPGSGKGTQAKLISKKFNIPHISTGDIFRDNIVNGTELGIKAKEFINNGELVPDDITIAMIEKELSEEKCNYGFILDGFPRNISQAEELNGILEKKGQSIDRVLFFHVPRYVIEERVKGRQICKCCGEIYNLNFNPSKDNIKCDRCNEILIHRTDDEKEVIKNRMAEYFNSIPPILNYYGDGGPLLVINGYGEIKDINNIVNRTLVSAKVTKKILKCKSLPKSEFVK